MSSGPHPGADEIEEITYSTLEVCRLTGVSYRMIDYWLRTGKVRIADDPSPGSGQRRRFTRTEVEALVDMVAHYRSAVNVMEDFRSGLLWENARKRADDRSRTVTRRRGFGAASPGPCSG